MSKMLWRMVAQSVKGGAPTDTGGASTHPSVAKSIKKALLVVLPSKRINELDIKNELYIRHHQCYPKQVSNKTNN